MFCCDTCNYQTTRKYNIKKHIKHVHNRYVSDNEFIQKENQQITTQNQQITTQYQQITTQNQQITTQNQQITTQNQQITTQDKNHVCQSCQKIFKSLWGFQKHQKICKGISNILECHYCHALFTKQQAKSRHLKTCKIKEAKMLVEKYMKANNISNNTQNTNNTQTNSNNTIQTIYNIQNIRAPYQPRIRYDYSNEDISGKLDFGKENRETTTKEEKEQISLSYNIKKMIEIIHFNDMYPENHNIRLNDNESYVVLRNNKWVYETKENICDIIYRNSQNEIKDNLYKYILNDIPSQEEKEFIVDEISKMDNADKKKKMAKYVSVKVKETTNNYQKKINNLQLEQSKQQHMISNHRNLLHELNLLD
jgi:hypothetical protein